MGDIIVQKYGGSSVATTEKITNIAKRLIERKKTDSKIIKKWETDGYAKVVCKVDSLEELLDLKKEADKNNVSNYLVVDAGRTQLPTSTTTVLGIGPDEDEIMDKITGDLKLLWVSFNLMIAIFN